MTSAMGTADTSSSPSAHIASRAHVVGFLRPFASDAALRRGERDVLHRDLSACGLLAAAFLLLAVHGYVKVRRGAAGNISAASNDSHRTSTAA
jgi:hypothetical protein